MLKAEYSISGKCLSITCSLHLDQEIQIEPIEAIIIRLPLLKSWRTILNDESAFMSTTGNVQKIGNFNQIVLIWIFPNFNC